MRSNPQKRTYLEVNYESQTKRQAYVRQMQSYQKKRQSYGDLL